MSDTLQLGTYELTEAHFERVRDLLYRLCGIVLRPGKEGLVKARLSKRLRALGLPGFADYLALVEGDSGGEELSFLVDSMTTNKTSFFREGAHFVFVTECLLPCWERQGRVRLWSAACSSGEEPYTLAMVLREHARIPPRLDVRILATDISTRVLEQARRGQYSADKLQDVPAALRVRHFRPVDASEDGGPMMELDPEVRRMVGFARLNLMDAWPMKGPFDAIFCRNVMIYFDKQAQGKLINRFHDLLAPGGHLFIGHSESLTGIVHRFRYVQPAVYLR